MDKTVIPGQVSRCASTGHPLCRKFDRVSPFISVFAGIAEQ
jgi:hypothetical protein